MLIAHLDLGDVWQQKNRVSLIFPLSGLYLRGRDSNPLDFFSPDPAVPNNSLFRHRIVPCECLSRRGREGRELSNDNKPIYDSEARDKHSDHRHETS